jgi:hypothetical protein
VFRAAALLATVAGRSGSAVKARSRGWLGARARNAGRAGTWSGAWGRFRKVTRRDWSGRFPGYEVPDLPRTDTDLEPLCGSHRSQERRSPGRKGAAPGLVVGGSVRLPAARATRLRGAVHGEDLVPTDPEAGRTRRAGLERRQAVRAQGRRFRRAPATYLQELEETLIKETLPPSKKTATKGPA